MATKLAAASFDTGAVLTVYQVRYKPVIHFCLPITTFSPKQCHAIQCHFFKAMLPKLGINRHMQRDVIYGPYELGGLNFLISRWTTRPTRSSSHRQCTQRGKLGGTLGKPYPHDNWSVSNSSRHWTAILKPGPWTVSSSPTEGNIMHYLHLGQGHIQIPATWRPPKANDRDEAIIDAVLRNLQANTPTLVKDTIWMVNACRLYLNVTMLSEILDADGNSIQHWVIYGTCTGCIFIFLSLSLVAGRVDDSSHQQHSNQRDQHHHDLQLWPGVDILLPACPPPPILFCSNWKREESSSSQW